MEWEVEFRKYHYKAMTATSEEEKLAINQELKRIYDSLEEEEKADFNKALQSFLVSEYSKIKSFNQQLKDDKESQ